MNLQDYTFYNELEESSLEFLKQHLRSIQVPKGNILFFQGDTCENILFLTSGKVRLYIQSDNADEITLYQLNAGEQCIVNTASTLSQTEAIGSAVTVTDIEGYLLDVQSVKELAHMGSLAKLVNDIKFKKLDERVLEWLQSQDDKIIEITHEKIANELGSSRVVISRVVKELEKQNKISLSRGTIELL